jgi:perosamine synthetase
MISIEPSSQRNDTPDFLPFSIPWIGDEEIEAVIECLRSGWITTGPRVRQFESEFADFVGARHAIALNSCTAALHLALEALDIRPGEHVIVPTMTFAATAEVVRYLNAKPVLLDCDSATLNLSIPTLETFLHEQCEQTADGIRSRESGGRVRALIPVHYAGLPCDMRPILDMAAEFEIDVIEDAAHAFPATYQGHTIGTLGTASAFSFYATKNLSTGEGGMLTTNSDSIAERVRLMSLHGISKDAWLRYTSQGSWYYEIVEAGFKYNLTDIAAALGIAQLRRANMLWKRRRQIARRYDQAFSEMPEIQTPVESLNSEHGWHLYPIRLNLDMLRIDRAAFIEELKKRRIGASVHFIPLHLHPYYRDNFGYRPQDLPTAAKEYERIISLPFYPRMSDSDVERVIDAVTAIAAEHAL